MALINDTDVLNIIGTNPGNASPEVVGRLAMLIPAVLLLAANYTGRAITQAQFSEQYMGSGSTVLKLRKQPVASVQFVSINNCTVTAATKDSNGAYDVLSRGYGFSESGIFLYGGLWFACADTPNVFVKYTGGYTTLPADMKDALVQEVAWQYNELGRFGKKSVRMSDAGVEEFELCGMAPRTKTTLNHYRIFNALN